VNQEDIQFAAAGVVADGLTSAIAIITTSIATRCAISVEVAKDLESALSTLSEDADPTTRITQMALEKTAQGLRRMKPREDAIKTP